MIKEGIKMIKKLLGIKLPCAFHSLTGLYCPGCGGTRAVRELFCGNLPMSFQYHPLVLYIAAVALLEITAWILSKAFNRPALYIRKYNVFLAIGVVIVMVNWIYKNYMLVLRGVDLLPPLK